MEQISVRPQFEAGRANGFVIYSIEPGSVFERMGLRDGDVIQGINGRTFTTTQPVLDFYDALKEGGTVSLEIQRDETKQKLLFEIR
jgi:general secretion pathway protein C